MLHVLLAASPDSGMADTMLPVARAFVARGHRVVFLAPAARRERVEQAGAVFVDAGRSLVAERVAPRRVLPGLQQIDERLRRQFLQPLPQQWESVQRVVAEHAIDVVVADPLHFGAAALGQLPREERPASVILGAFPLALPDPTVAPYGLGLLPSGQPVDRLRNAVLHALVHGVVLRRSTRDLQAAVGRLTGRRTRGGLHDLTRFADAWAQLTVERFEYPRARADANLVFVGPLRPEESGELPDWWDYSDARPLVCVRWEPGVPLENLVLPAIEGLRDEPVLVVVTGPCEADVVLALGGPLPANVRVEHAVPYAHLLSSAKAVVKAGDYVQTQYALRWGVPLVVSGTAEEQVETNARVQWAGVGVNLRSERPSAQQMREAVLRVLHDPGMRRAAARIAAQIARTDAESTLVDLAEHVVTRPVRGFVPGSVDAAG